MRIALITERFPPLCCGVGDYALGLARALSEQGHEIVVITRPAGGPRPMRIRVVETSLHGWRDLRGLLRVIEHERVEQVQIEYSGYGWSRWGFSFWLNGLVAALRWKKIPVNLGLHETYLNFMQHPRLIPIAVLQRMHVWLLIAASSQVFVNMPERQQVLRRRLSWCRARIHYRPNSSTIPVVPQTAAARSELRARQGAAPNDLVVATLGMFHAVKNLEAVIEAVARARTARPLRLWLLGDTRSAQKEYLEALRRRINSLGMAERVLWAGYLEAADLSAHLQSADVFVLPQSDGHLTRSSTFMAAAAHGLPVIAVGNAKNQGEFTSGEHVWLVKKSDPAEFAKSLETLEREPALAARLGTNLARLYRERFDWPITVGARSEEKIAQAPALDPRGAPEAARKNLG